METLWAGLSSPSISALLRYRAKEKPHFVGSPLQLSPSGGCCGFLQRSSKEPAPSSHSPLVGSQQQALAPQRSRGEIPQHPGRSQSATPHAPTLLVQTAGCPQRTRERNDLLLPPLLFCKQGSLNSWWDTWECGPKRREGKCCWKDHVHQMSSEKAKCPCSPEDLFLSSHMVTPHMNMSS